MADCCDVFKMVDEGDSFQSWNGLRGPYFVPHLSADGVLSWTNTGNLPNPAPVDISGPPGVSVELRGPVASVGDLPATASSSELWLVGAASPYDGWFYNGVQWENAGQIAVGPAGPQGEPGPAGPAGPQGEPGTGLTISGTVATVADLPATAAQSTFYNVGTAAPYTIYMYDTTDGWISQGQLEGPAGPTGPQGPQGETGPQGPAGADGVSPEISITNITGGHRVTITDEDHPQGQSFDVLDGEDGSPGSAGADGVSPEISITNITGGHRVTITDASGTRSFDVMDGASTTVAGILKGDGNGGVSAAVAGTDYLTPGTNYSPVKITNASSYSIVADDAGKTILIDTRYSTVTLDSAVASAMPVGTEIALSPSQFATDAYITLTLPTSTGRAAGAGGAFSTVKLKGGWNMYALKKMWSTGWYVTGPDLEVVT